MTQMGNAQSKLYGQIVAQAWADPEFKRRLLADPAAVLRERGIELPAGARVRVVEDTDEVVHLALPYRTGELSAEQLDQAAGGTRDKDPWPSIKGATSR